LLRWIHFDFVLFHGGAFRGWPAGVQAHLRIGPEF